jgi:hypothetical protein
MEIKIMKQPSAGAQLAAMRKPKAKVCPVCQIEFIGIGRRIYCSSACRNKAYYLRQKEFIIAGKAVLQKD